MDDFYRIIESAHAEAAPKEVKQESAIRVYSTQHAKCWSLQVRASQRLHNGAAGRTFFIASASLTRDDMAALRDAIDGFLEDES